MIPKLTSLQVSFCLRVCVVFLFIENTNSKTSCLFYFYLSFGYAFLTKYFVILILITTPQTLGIKLILVMQLIFFYLGHKYYLTIDVIFQVVDCNSQCHGWKNFSIQDYSRARRDEIFYSSLQTFLFKYMHMYLNGQMSL